MRKIYILVFVLLQLACEEIEKDTFSYTGDFFGSIRGDSMHWYNGLHNPGSVQVIFDRGDKIFKTSSDSSGNFEFSSIPYGTYNITLSKENYVPTFVPGYQLYFTKPEHEDLFYIFKKGRIENIHVKLILLNGYKYYDVICDGEFAENERVELIIFLHETEEADYTNYTSYKYMDYCYSEYCGNELFWSSDSLITSSFYAIYPVVGFNWADVDWHMIDDLRDYPTVLDKDICYKGFYLKNKNHDRY